MNIRHELSSQIGDRSEAANRRVASDCLADPSMLAVITDGLGAQDAALVGDCAEVLTKVAESQPDLVAPYAPALAALLGHKTTRVRWEAMHAIALVADRVPELVTGLLPRLAEMLAGDKSTIVRDYATETLTGYAKVGRQSAEAAFPELQRALMVWEGKHAGRALNGLAAVAVAAPHLAKQILEIAEGYLGDRRGVVKKAAKAAVKAAGNVAP